LTPHEIGRGFIVVFAVLLVRFIAMEAVFQRARRSGAGLRFPVGFVLRLVCRLGGPCLLFAGYQVALGAVSGFDWLVVALSWVMALGCVFAEPGEIETAPDALIQTSLVGLRKRRIPCEGAAARYVAGLREVLVVGSDGTAITHSQYHVGQSEFLNQLRLHKVFVQS